MKKEIQRIRGPRLAVFIKSRTLLMEEVLRRADDEGLAIASNRSVNEALGGGVHKWCGIRDALPCWTGTMLGYDEPGKPLGSFIEYTDQDTKVRYLFPVPLEHRGKSDIALVAEHPDFELLRDGGDRVVMASKIGVVARFPNSDDVYFGDPAYDIPAGDKVGADVSGCPRLLWRTGKRVGLVVSGYAGIPRDPRHWEEHRRVCRPINVNGRHCEVLGAVAEFGDKPMVLTRTGDDEFSVRGPPIIMDSVVRAFDPSLLHVSRKDGELIARGPQPLIEAVGTLLELLRRDSSGMATFVKEQWEDGLSVKGPPEQIEAAAKLLQTLRENVAKKGDEMEIISKLLSITRQGESGLAIKGPPELIEWVAHTLGSAGDELARLEEVAWK